MRVAVTGSAGYLGRPIAEALAADDRVEEVVAIDRRPPATVLRDVRDPAIAGDLAGCDAVLHLAFRVLGRGRDAESVNIEGSRNVFDAAIRAGVTTIIHASSAAAYGSAPDNPVPLTENCELRPLPPFYYPQTKIAVERMLSELEVRHPDVRVVRMRPVSTLGPGAPVLARGRVFPTLSDFDPLMQFTWLDDVVAAFVAALHAPWARGAYNVGAPAPVRSSEVAGLMGARRLRLPHRVLRLVTRAAMDPAWADMARYPIVVDTARAERELGWRAGRDCTAALRRYGEVFATTREAA